jgi:nucleotide-binding universal stress UspA family protein
MKILLPVDGSPYTKRMLAWLVTHDEWLKADHEFTVLTVVPMIPPHAAAMFPEDQLKSYYEDTAEAIFKPIRKFVAKHNLATNFVSKVGDKGKHDLIVMGSHGHSNLMNLVMGSVTNQVLARSKAPVLLVR